MCTGFRKISGLKFNGTFAGYSPERINPGTKNIPLRKY
jgi:UDP-N-acetyl-D-mannosaminuronate dehydrogenase